MDVRKKASYDSVVGKSNEGGGGGGEKGIEISGDVFLRVRGKNVIVSS